MQDLQSYIATLESKLISYSFEELSSKEAVALRSSLNSFKQLFYGAIADDESLGKNTNSDFQKPLTNVHPKGFKKSKNLNHLQQEDATLLARTSQQFAMPINGVLGIIETLLKSDLSQKQLALVQSIKNTSQGLLTLSEDLLEYSSLWSTKEKPSSFKFYSVIRDVLFLCNTLVVDKNLSIETDIDPNIPSELIAEPEKISQILMNLIGNAIKYTKEGVVLIKIALKEEYLDNILLEFEICDTGNGVADEDLEHVFNPYKNVFSSQIDNKPNFCLSVAQQLIQNSGGHIYASSRLGIGSVLTFTIPLKYKDMEKTIEEIDTSSVQSLQILVFEDNDLNQKLIELKLRKWNSKTFITDNLENGIQILENNKIDIILMDINMPKNNGYRVTEIIREHGDTSICNIPIIAVTADSIQQNIEHYAENGFNDFLIKPYNSDELLIKLAENKSQKTPNMEQTKTISKDETKLNNRVDLGPILEDCMGNIQLLEELILLYRKNALEFIGKTKVSLDLEDYDSLWQNAHKIKTGIAMVGTTRLLETLTQFEKNAKTEKDLKHLTFLYNCFVDEYKDAEAKVFHALNKLKRNN